MVSSRAVTTRCAKTRKRRRAPPKSRGSAACSGPAWSFTVPIFLLAMSMMLGLMPELPWANWVMFALATPVQFYVGWQYYVGGYKALKNGSANMDVLIAMGSSVAYFYSVVVLLAGASLGSVTYFETSALIITLIRVGKYLEAVAKGRTSAAIKALMGLRATTARVVRDGVEQDVPIDSVRVGDVVIVRPGEKIPVDGIVIDGRCYSRRIDADRRKPARRQTAGR